MSDGVRTPSFFIIAGLFFPDNTSFHKLALNKINRLIIPYLFFAAIYYATDVLLNPTSILELSTPSDWYKFLFYNRNYPTWFLTALFYAYIVFYAIRPLLNRSSWFIQIAIVIAIGLAGRCLSEYLPYHFRENSIFSLWYFTHFSIGIEVIPLVYAGYMFKRSRFFTYSPPPHAQNINFSYRRDCMDDRFHCHQQFLRLFLRQSPTRNVCLNNIGIFLPLVHLPAHPTVTIYLIYRQVLDNCSGNTLYSSARLWPTRVYLTLAERRGDSNHDAAVNFRTDAVSAVADGAEAVDPRAGGAAKGLGDVRAGL